MTRRAVLVLLAVVTLTACEGHKRPPALFDGSAPGGVPQTLQNVRDALITRVQVVGVDDLPARLRSTCPDFRARSRIVERTSVDGVTLTALDRGGSLVRSCDRARDVYTEGRPWCGFSAGKRLRGKLTDPRLAVCQGLHGGRYVAFAWIDPLPSARWVGIDQGSYTELYRAAAGLPVRVSTTRDVESAEAVFHVTQYTIDGRLLSRERLETYVAG